MWASASFRGKNLRLDDDGTVPVRCPGGAAPPAVSSVLEVCGAACIVQQNENQSATSLNEHQVVPGGTP